MVGDSRWLYTGLLALVVIERLVEMILAKRNARWLLERGAFEVGAAHYPAMVMLHGLFLASCLVEVWVLDRPLLPPLALVMASLLAGSMAVRYWVIGTLGRRWTTRVLCLPGEPRITMGPYQLARHPNYLAVRLEILALPLIHTAWLTAVVFSLANHLLLRARIRVEDAALAQAAEMTG